MQGIDSFLQIETVVPAAEEFDLKVLVQAFEQIDFILELLCLLALVDLEAILECSFIQLLIVFKLFLKLGWVAMEESILYLLDRGSHILTLQFSAHCCQSFRKHGQHWLEGILLFLGLGQKLMVFLFYFYYPALELFVVEELLHNEAQVSFHFLAHLSGQRHLNVIEYLLSSCLRWERVSR